MTTKNSTRNKLVQVLGMALRFGHNVNLTDLVGTVYGRTETNKSYLRSKVELIDRKGFAWWYCELDLEHQRVVADLMLERYDELASVLEGDGRPVSPEQAAIDREVQTLVNMLGRAEALRRIEAMLSRVKS